MQALEQLVTEKAQIGYLEAFQALKNRSRLMRSEPWQVRITRLKKLRSWILGNRERLHAAMFKDFRKPAMEVESAEIFTVLAEINHAIENLHHWVAPKKVDAPLTFLGTRSVINTEPKGVCLIISPWNYPFNLAIGPLVSCIAAGNTALVKPSELTPNTSSLIAAMADEVFDKDEVSVVTGDVSVSERLLRLPFDHIFFTGSPSVGKLVMRAAADNLASVTLELGGKSPAIIDSTANLGDAARRVAFGKFFNNGQTCIAPDYVLIDKNVRDEFVERLGKNINRLFGNGRTVDEDSADYARIVNARHFSRLSRLVQDAIDKGARPVFGGSINEKNLFFPPTILTGVSADSAIMEEEIFGPVLPVVDMDSQQDAIEIVNSKPKPLALYLFSNDKKFRTKVLRETSAGGVCINDCVLQFVHPNLPFGGVNNSGVGKSHGHAGFMTFSNEKPVIVQKSGLSNAYLFHPPFGPLKRRILDWVTRYFI